MLQVTDTGVQVILKGKSTHKGFVMAVALVSFALLVAAALAILPTHYALITLALLGCVALAFGWYRQKNIAQQFSHGLLKVSPFALNCNHQSHVFSSTLTVIAHDSQLTLIDHDLTLVITGFENDKECQIVKSVLLGATIQTHAKSIKLKASNSD